MGLGSSDRLRNRSIGGISGPHVRGMGKVSIDPEDLEAIRVLENGARPEVKDVRDGYLIQICDYKGRVPGSSRDGDGSLGLERSMGTMGIVPSRLGDTGSITGGLDKSGCFEDTDTDLLFTSKKVKFNLK